jgi:hypothetical protein
MTQRLNYTTIAPVGVKALGGVSLPGARQAPCSTHANVRLWLGLKQSRASPTPLYGRRIRVGVGGVL